MIDRFQMFIKFMLSGGPAFLLAVPINYLLVESIGVLIPVAYWVVLVFQLLMNFIMLKLFVFKRAPGGSIFVLSEMITFFSGVIGLRVMDWLLYTALTMYVSVYFVYAQVFNMVFFSVLRFLFAEKVLHKNNGL